MPRVLAGGPALAVSPDNSSVVVLDRGRLSLVDVRGRREVGEAQLAESADGAVAWVGDGSRLITVTPSESATLMCAYQAPELEQITRLEMPPGTRALAFVGDHVLVVDGEGDSKLVTLTTKMLVAEPISLRGVPRVAAEAPEGRLLVESRGQLEFWHPSARRALFRLNLPLPDAPSGVGFAGRGRLLWISARTGRFDVFRFSDGRPQLQIDLGQEILAVEGSATNNRVILAVRANSDAPVRLMQIDLGLREQQELEIEHPLAGFAVVEGDQPLIVAAASGAPLAFLSLSKASGTARGVPLAPPTAAEESFSLRSPEAVARAEAATAQSTAGSDGAQGARPNRAADRFAAWRSRLQGGRVDESADPAPDSVAADEPATAPPAIDAPASRGALPETSGRRISAAASAFDRRGTRSSPLAPPAAVAAKPDAPRAAPPATTAARSFAARVAAAKKSPSAARARVAEMMAADAARAGDSDEPIAPGAARDGQRDERAVNDGDRDEAVSAGARDGDRDESIPAGARDGDHDETLSPTPERTDENETIAGTEAPTGDADESSISNAARAGDDGGPGIAGAPRVGRTDEARTSIATRLRHGNPPATAGSLRSRRANAPTTLNAGRASASDSPFISNTARVDRTDESIAAGAARAGRTDETRTGGPTRVARADAASTVGAARAGRTDEPSRLNALRARPPIGSALRAGRSDEPARSRALDHDAPTTPSTSAQRLTDERSTPSSARESPDPGQGWRGALVAWGRACLDASGTGEPPPLDDAAPVNHLADRFALEPVAVRALALLYASWLLGRGREGIAAAQVAQLVAEDEAWPEALGRGELARAGIARARRGRLILRSVAGYFLDGAPPRTPIAWPARLAGAPEPIEVALVPIGDESPQQLALRLAPALGRAVAVIDLGAARSFDRRLKDGLFEARTAGAVALLVSIPEAALSGAPLWLGRLAGCPSLLALADEPPPALAHLPVLRSVEPAI